MNETVLVGFSMNLLWFTMLLCIMYPFMTLESLELRKYLAIYLLCHATYRCKICLTEACVVIFKKSADTLSFLLFLEERFVQLFYGNSQNNVLL